MSDMTADRVGERLGTKVVLPVVCAVSMILASVVGTSILNRLDRIEAALQGLQIDAAVMKTDIQYLKGRTP